MMGLCTDICVISNALDVRMWIPAARIIVHEQGCAGTSPEKHLAALEVMKSNLIEVEYDD
jgi:nicotinamidase-related amidase